MSHDVFISYAHDDKAIADAACAVVEKAGIRCWIAPRDIVPGADYAAALLAALDHCKAFVLIFSDNANESPHIRREVERAVSRAIPLIPVRIKNIEPSAALRYFVGSVHWLDALTPPLEQHFERLAQTLKAILAGAPAPPEPRPSAAAASQTLAAAAAPSVLDTRKLDRVRYALVASMSIGFLLCLLAVMIRDTPSLLAGLGGLALTYALIYRNIPGDLVTARLIYIILTGCLGYFLLVNLMALHRFYVVVEGIDMACCLYGIQQLQSAMATTHRPRA